MIQTALDGRIVVSRTTLVLVLGDIVAIAVFVGGGEMRHAGSLADGVSAFVQFGIGWLIAGVLVGVYGSRAVDSWYRAGGLAAITWVFGVLIAQLVRLGMNPTASLSIVFIGVSILFGGVLVVIWRVLAARIVGT